MKRFIIINGGHTMVFFDDNQVDSYYCHDKNANIIIHDKAVDNGKRYLQEHCSKSLFLF